MARVKRSWMVRAAGGVLAAVVVAIVVGVAILAFMARDLPSPDRVVRREGFATRIFDRRGELLYDVFSDQRRTPVDLKQVPEVLKQATIAIEDKNFYKHQGVDAWGILRAVVKTIVYRRLEGGSTLTQQLVKNVLLTPRRDVARKLREFILTLQVERKYSKDQILQMYLNEAPYGGTAWGVAAASEIYFAKPVAEVNLAEAAILAGLPQSPTVYSPARGKEFLGRAKEVLRRMREDGYISRETEREARGQLEEVKIATGGGELKAPHFVFYVQKELVRKYGEKIVEQGGLRVTTTLDSDLQMKAQAIVTEEIAKVKHLKISNGAAVVMDPGSGQILAMVGSRGWGDEEIDGKFNVAADGVRQPGSAIKPVTYLTALRKGYTAATLLMDTKTSFPGGDKPEYVPENYDGKFRGPVLVREALGNSLNIPAVKMLSLVGVKDMLAMGHELGLTTFEPTPELLARVGLSVTLGGGEVRLLDLAAAYSAFANGGRKTEPVAILKVVDNSGKILEEWSDQEKRQVISPEEAFIISSILSDSAARQITFGAATSLTIPGKTAAVKTGTTNDRRDNWTVGWTPSVLTGVWVGNNDNSPMREVASGVTGASPIWKRIMVEANKDKGNEEFARPQELIEMEVDSVSGYPAHDGFASRKEFFIKGTEPFGDDPVHKKIKVCRGEGKLATPADAASGNYDEREAYYFKEEDPLATAGGANRWQEGVLAWLAQQADPKYHPPSEYCGSTNPVWITILAPGDKQRIDSGDVNVRVDVADVNKVTKVEFYLDNNLRYTLTEEPWEVTVPNVDSGVHRIDIKAYDEKGHEGSRFVEIGVNQDWVSPTPAP